MGAESETDKLLKVISFTLAIIAYVLIISYYLPKSPLWREIASTLRALKSRWEGHRIPALAYSIRHEVPPIIGASLLINFVGSEMVSRNPSVLYLDMAGTAAAALLLGPWWGAIVGILTNTILSMMHPSEANINFVPWLVVNLVGGIYWGLMARRKKFRSYVSGSSSNIVSQTRAHLWFLLCFGVLGALIMGAAGAVVEVVLDYDPRIFAPNSDFGTKMYSLFLEQDQHIRAASSLGGYSSIQPFLSGLLRWGLTTFRYIPDKTFSAAVGLLTAKYAFPLFERNLITGKESENGLGDNWLTPAMAVVCYVAVVPWSATNSPPPSWFWYGPLIVLLGACVFEFLFGADSETLLRERNKRVRSYFKAKAQLPREEFFGAIVVAVLVSSLAFMSGLLFIKSVDKRGTVALSFLATTLAYFLAFYLMRVGMRQWAAFLSPDWPGREAPPSRKERHEPVGATSEPRPHLPDEFVDPTVSDKVDGVP